MRAPSSSRNAPSQKAVVFLSAVVLLAACGGPSQDTPKNVTVQDRANRVKNRDGKNKNGSKGRQGRQARRLDDLCESLACTDPQRVIAKRLLSQGHGGGGSDPAPRAVGSRAEATANRALADAFMTATFGAAQLQRYHAVVDGLAAGKDTTPPSDAPVPSDATPVTPKAKPTGSVPAKAVPVLSKADLTPAKADLTPAKAAPALSKADLTPAKAGPAPAKAGPAPAKAGSPTVAAQVPPAAPPVAAVAQVDAKPGGANGMLSADLIELHATMTADQRDALSAMVTETGLEWVTGPGQGRKGSRKSERPALDDERQAAMMSRRTCARLDCGDIQQADIATLFGAWVHQTQDAPDSARQTLAAAVGRESLAPAAIQDYLDAVAAHRATMRVSNDRVWAELHALLEPDQRTTLAEAITVRGYRAIGRGRGRRHGPMGRRLNGAKRPQ